MLKAPPALKTWVVFSICVIRSAVSRKSKYMCMAPCPKMRGIRRNVLREGHIAMKCSAPSAGENLISLEV